MLDIEEDINPEDLEIMNNYAKSIYELQKTRKNIIDYISEQKISESNIDMDDLLSAVDSWFYSHCGEDDYDSPRRRIADLDAMFE